MNDWDEESTEFVSVKKIWPEYVFSFINPIIAFGCVIYFNFSYGLFKAIGLWIGMHFLSIGLLGLFLKRTWYKNVIYRGETGRSISSIYFSIGLLICIGIFLFFR